MSIFKTLRLYLLLTIVSSNLSANAQELSFKSFVCSNEVMTIPMQRTDKNDEICALVKVQLPVAGCTFEGNVIGVPEFLTNEYWVYMTGGSRQLLIKCPNCHPMMINFSLDGVPQQLQKKTVYRLVLDVPKERFGGTNISITELDKALEPAINMYKQEDYERASQEFKKIKESMGSKGLTYAELDDWLNRCAMASTMKRLGVTELYSMKDGICLVYASGGHGYIDSLGNVIVEPQYYYATDFIDGIAMVDVGEYDNNICGIINRGGKYIVEPKYEWIHLSSHGVAWVEEDDKWGLVDKTGKLMLKPQYLYVMDKDINLRYVAVAKKKTESNSTLLYQKASYNWVHGRRNYYKSSDMAEGGAYYVPISESRNHYEGDEREYTDWGLVDKYTGKVILDCKYMGCYQTSDYICFVDKNRNPIFIDPKTGKEKFSLPSGIKYIRPYLENYAIISKVNKFRDRPNLVGSRYRGMTCLENLGLIDGNGNEIIPPEYSYIEAFDIDFYPNLFTVEKINRNDSYVALFDLDTKEYTQITIEDVYESCPYRDYLLKDIKTNSRFRVLRFESLGDVLPWGVVTIPHYEFGILDINTHKLLTPFLSCSDMYGPGRLEGDYNYVYKSYDKNSPIILKEGRKYNIYSIDGSIYNISDDIEVKDGFHHGRALVKQGGYYGYIDEKGKLAIPCKYYDAKNFVEKDGAICAEVRENSSEPSKYIDIYGNEITK